MATCSCKDEKRKAMCSSPKSSGANNALSRTLGIALVLLVTFAVLQAASSNAEVTAINKLQKQVDDAIVACDTERYVALLVDDAVLMPPNALPVVGREAIRSWNVARDIWNGNAKAPLVR